MNTKNQELLELLSNSVCHRFSKKQLANGDLELAVELPAKVLDIMERCKLLEANYESLLNVVTDLFQVTRNMVNICTDAEKKNARQWKIIEELHPQIVLKNKSN